MKRKINTTLIEIKTSKEDWKATYTLRGRIGIRILQLLQVVSIKWIKN